MSWNISVTTVIGGGGNRPGIYAGKFSPNEFHDLPFLVKLPVGSLFLKTGEQNPDCTVGCAAGIYQKVCGGCGSSSWREVAFSPPPTAITFTTVDGGVVNINLAQSGDIPHWVSGDGAEYDSVNFSHTYAPGSFDGYAQMYTGATEVVCNSNRLTALDVTALASLADLRCYRNQLTELDVTSNPLLNRLECDDNQLTAIDVSANPLLEYLDCYKNQLTVLDVTSNPLIYHLACRENPINVLDVSANPLLKHLECFINQLTVLDVTSNPLLEYLDCRINQLTALDVSANPLLEYLDCRINQLTALDVSANPLLEYLECGLNQLTAIDLSANPLLKHIKLSDNLMPEAAVDQVIADVESHGTSDGNLAIAGTNAAPSAAGLADAALLTGRGWTVTVTP